MKDEEIVELAKPYQWQGRQGMGWVFNSDKELVSFARAIADLQKEKDAKICEWVDANTTECPEMAIHCADAIRSPETDLDEALRRQ